jgi:tetratricopeptide (TPR) repeat protein
VSASVTAYRVLIEVPDELEEEFRAFGEVVHNFDDIEALPRNAYFLPVAWAKGSGPSYGLVEQDLKTIDYFVLVLSDRWPAGVERGFEIALECLQSAEFPMAAVVPFFRATPSHRLSDPDEQLRKVLALKEKLESDQQLRFETFDSLDMFRKRLRWHLSDWLIGHEGRQRASTPSADAAEEPGLVGKTHPLDDSPVSFNEYGLFLQRQGFSAEAETTHRQALELAGAKGPPEAVAIAYGNLGEIYQRRQQPGRAEEFYRKALETCEQLGCREGMAACYNGLGVVYRGEKDYDRAESMFRKGLRIETEIGREEGMVACYRNLEALFRERQDREKAQQMRRLGDAIREEPEYPFGNLFPSRI